MLDIIEAVNQWLADGKPVALATVVETWGSSPRQAGAKMAITSDLDIVGSVSAGCVEGAVADQALDVLKKGKPRLLHFGVSDEQAWEVGLSCGGKITVFVEPLDTTWWREVGSKAGQVTAASLTIVEGPSMGAKLVHDGRHSVIYADGLLSPDRVTALAEAPRRPTSGLDTLLGESVMVDQFQEPAHLIMVGGVHIAMALAQFAHIVGIRVTLIDPREAFASAGRFPGVQIINEYPDRALASMPIGRSTYFALVTHDPKIDDPALEVALRSDAAYIGVLGSRKTHQQRLERLRVRGFGDADFARLHAPVGLPIHSKTPEEIALSIIAEIVSIKNAPTQA